MPPDASEDLHARINDDSGQCSAAFPKPSYTFKLSNGSKKLANRIPEAYRTPKPHHLLKPESPNQILAWFPPRFCPRHVSSPAMPAWPPWPRPLASLSAGAELVAELVRVSPGPGMLRT